jgi:hypothetical protein
MTTELERDDLNADSPWNSGLKNQPDMEPATSHAISGVRRIIPEIAGKIIIAFSDS